MVRARVARSGCEAVVPLCAFRTDSGQAPEWHPQRMFRAIRNLVLYRIVGGRIMLAVALLGFARRLLGSRRKAVSSRETVYQPSQGSSQIVHRDPR
jgi:hypothetical protein